jgi:hypothetical protein
LAEQELERKKEAVRALQEAHEEVGVGVYGFEGRTAEGEGGIWMHDDVKT